MTVTDIFQVAIKVILNYDLIACLSFDLNLHISLKVNLQRVYQFLL